MSADVVLTVKLWASMWSKRLQAVKDKEKKVSSSGPQKQKVAARHPAGFPLLVSHCAKIRFATLTVNELPDNKLMFTGSKNSRVYQGWIFLILV